MNALLESMILFRQFRDRLDQTIQQAWEQYQSQMQCKAGCFSCCRNDFRISLVEALTVRNAVSALVPDVQDAIRENLSGLNEQSLCPLLVAGQCSIYEERPLLCRVFGFPVSDGETIATCELNFQESQEVLFSAQCFDSRVLAQSLHSLSRLYLQEIGQPLPSEEEIPPMGTIPQVVTALFSEKT